MFFVVTGGSGSGKSAYAEDLILKLKANEQDSQLIYLATMMPYGEETRKKIDRHISLRAGKGFETIECFGGLKDVGWNSKDIVLLECMSNLLADEIYEQKSDNAVEEIMQGIEKLYAQCRHVVVVTNEVFSDGIAYEEETISYIRQLAMINRRMAKLADSVTEVVYGIPVRLK